MTKDDNNDIFKKPFGVKYTDPATPAAEGYGVDSPYARLGDVYTPYAGIVDEHYELRDDDD